MVAAFLAAFAMLMANFAYATDTLVADGDGLSPVAASTLALGNVCQGASKSSDPDVALQVQQENDNPNNSFADSASVSVTRGTITNPNSGNNGALSANATVGTISLPSDWNIYRDDDNNRNDTKVSATVTSDVTVAVPATASIGNYTGSVVYSASGDKLGGGTLSRSATLTVSWSVLASTDTACLPSDTSPPTITCTPSTASTSWFGTNQTVECSATDASGLSTATPSPQTLSTTVASGVENSSASTGSYEFCDTLNNCATAGPITGWKIDRKVPTIATTGATTSPNTAGWYNVDVVVGFTAEDLGSGLGTFLSPFTQTTSGEGTAVTVSSGAVADAVGNNNTGINSAAFKIDKTRPSVEYTSATAGTGNGPNAAGWYKAPVTATFTGTDNLSGFDSLGTLTATNTATSGASEEGTAVAIQSPAFTDQAGNTQAAGATSQNFKIDVTDPTNIQFVGGPAAGSSHYFGSVPAAPTCTADDAISLLASCVVTDYSTAIGTHTLTATATDNAGRTATAQRTYSVLAWTLSGFYSPVDMNSTLNSAKSGSTVPLKFEAFAGTELTDTAVVNTFKVGEVPCGALNTTVTDDIENYTSGGTSLRYDSTAGQFIQNWQTPKGKAGACYKVVLTLDDGSSATAYFKLK